MASVRTVRRQGRVYRYLVQSYRWDGTVRQKTRYLGTTVPTDLAAHEAALEDAILQATWYRRLDAIRDAYRARLRKVPRSLSETESEEFVVDFTFNTNRIEGSTLTLDETERLLERDVAPAKPLRDILEAKAHAGLFRRLLKAPERVDLHHLLNWHRELFQQTKPDIAGNLREVEVGIRGSRHLPPTPIEVRPMLVELLRWTSRARSDEHPVRLAANFHWRFEHIHPFADGNGRVGRIALNVLLAQAGFPPMNIRYSGRKGYNLALERASLRDDPRPFLLWFFRIYAKAQSMYLRSPP